MSHWGFALGYWPQYLSNTALTLGPPEEGQYGDAKQMSNVVENKRHL